MRARHVGVDVGGTFTDLIWIDGAGAIGASKVASTPSAPDEGVIAGIDGTPGTSDLSRASVFRHGTTVGLNALLTAGGTRVALITTRGFRDVLEIRRGARPDPFVLTSGHPPPLVERDLRLEVTERIRADGTVDTPLDELDVDRAHAAIARAGIESVAVCLLHAYAHPDHELAVERRLRDLGFDGRISLSHRVSGEHREYERTATTVVDAYIGPVTQQYVGRLEQALRGRGLTGPALMTRSGGGALTFDEAAARPFEVITSGPVAGVAAGAALARRAGLGEVVTADVGGTSFDTSLVLDGEPTVLPAGVVAGLPLQAPWVDVRSIGAGGGSLARVDRGGLLRVGPESAGALPGPACYGRGGIEPTVTDAMVVLGMFGTGRLGSGLVLDEHAAAVAVDGVADAFGGDRLACARGIIQIAAANMADAIREVTVEQGRDPRTATLVAFGGAGPLIATAIADELDMRHIVVPPYAGNFSAWGLLESDIVRSRARTLVVPADDASLAAVDGVLDALFDELGGADGGEPQGALDMRYRGQEHSVTIPVPLARRRLAGTGAEIRSAFAERYAQRYGYRLGDDVEVVTVRATLTEPVERPVARSVSEPIGRSVVEATSVRRGERLPFTVLGRGDLGDAAIAGPAIIVEQTTTTYVDVGWSAALDDVRGMVLAGTGEATA